MLARDSSIPWKWVNNSVALPFVFKMVHKRSMKSWTVEQRTTFSLAIVFILLGVLNLIVASMTFRFSHSLAYSMLDMTLFFSIAAFIVVRRITKILLRAKAAEEASANQLRSQEAKHAQLIRGIEQVAESIVIADLNGAILYVNPAFEKVTGYARAEAIGQNARILQSGQHSTTFYEAMWTTLLSGETWSGDLINRRKDGTLFNEVATISPIKDEQGESVSFVAVKRDVTHEILLRNQLKQAQKMEALGRLAGGVAHDFNNLLMVIRTYTEMIRDRLPKIDSLGPHLEEVLKAAERGASLCSQMLAFSRQQVIRPTVLDLSHVIGDTATMMQRVIGEHVEFQVKLCDSIWAVEADRDQIVQILMNLCINARDAMPRGGTLKIETGNVTVKQPSQDLPTYIVDGDYATFSVSDSGVGVDKEIQGQVFEPFFTTKATGDGTGLGLAMVYGIAKQSGGYVRLDSDPGCGACFTIYLPKVELPVIPRVIAHAEGPLRGTETLLLVEDEESLRAGLCQFLRSLGYLVLTAGSGEEALIPARGRHVDLLVTDVILPGMSGREIFEELGRNWPKLKALYISGYTDDAVLKSCVREQHTAFLQKPFGLSTLAGKVRDTLRPMEPIH